MIQLEPGDWEGYINEIRASLDTNKILETPNTKADLVADKVKTPAQTLTSMGKTDQEKSMELSPTTQPIKCVTEKSPSKIKPKDRSPIRPPLLQIPLPTRIYKKTTQKLLQNKKPSKVKMLTRVTNSKSQDDDLPQWRLNKANWEEFRS